MRFSARSDNGLTGTGQILSTADPQQGTTGGSLGITLNGETNTLTGFTIDYDYNLSTNSNNLRIDGTISSSIPGAPFQVTTPTALQKSPPSAAFSDTPPGPFAGGSLRIVGSDNAELLITITSSVDKVGLRVDGVDLPAIDWAALLRS